MGKAPRRTRSSATTGGTPPVAAPDYRAEPTVEFFLCFVLAVTPLCLLNGVFLSHDVMPKVIVTLACAGILLLLLPHWAAGTVRLWHSPGGKAFLLLGLAQFASLAASSAASGEPGLSLVGTVWRRFGAVEQIAVLVVAIAASALASIDGAWPTTLFRAMAIGGSTASLYGVFQYFGVDPFLDEALYRVEFLGGIVRPPATMGHAIYFAAWLVPVVLIAGARAFAEEGRVWPRIHAATAVLGCVAIFLSGSRGALLAVTAGILFFALRAGSTAAVKPGRQTLAAAGVVLILGVVITLSPAGNSMRHRLLQWRQDPGGTRLAVWRESPQIIAAHPLTGTGPETFGEEFRRIESVQLSRAFPDFYNETPHNAFIDAACAQGIPGLLILSGIFVLGIAVPRQTPGGKPAALQITHAGLQAAALGILTASLFASFTIVQSMYLWSIVGISAALVLPNGGQERVKAPTVLLVPGTLLAGMFLLTALLLAVPDAAYANLAAAVQQKNLALASGIYEKDVTWSLGLPVPGYEVFASQQFAVLARSLSGPDAGKAWSESARAATDATRRSEERFSAAYQACVLAIANADLGKAEAEARASIALAPNWYRPHAFLAQILQATGRTAEAAAEQQESIRLGAGTR